MMKIFATLALISFVCADPPYQGHVDLNRFLGKYVFDLLKPALQPAEVEAIESLKGAGAFPTYNTIPVTKFDCSSKAGPGFYADVEAQCQVFHRCDLAGNVTDYLCVNTTIFNQITLVCDKFYNVDCGRSLEFENFANSRLYTDKPLFDSPPAGYIAPSQQIASTVNVAPVSKNTGGKITVSGSASSSGRSDDTSSAGEASANALASGPVADTSASAASGDSLSG